MASLMYAQGEAQFLYFHQTVVIQDLKMHIGVPLLIKHLNRITICRS